MASGGTFVTAGKLKALGVGGPTRIKALADLPTVVEQTGFKEFTGYTWNVLVSAKGTPPDVIDKLNTAINEISAKPEVIEKARQCRTSHLAGRRQDDRGLCRGQRQRATSASSRLTGVKRE